MELNARTLIQYDQQRQFPVKYLSELRGCSIHVSKARQEIIRVTTTNDVKINLTACMKID